MKKPVVRRVARGGPRADKIAKLRARAEEAEELLRAITEGEVDAVVRSGSAGDQIFTVKGAEHSYRLMVETMDEGAVTLGLDGVILYCNQRFAELLQRDLQQVIGARMHEFLIPDQQEQFAALMKQAGSNPAKGSIDMLRPDGILVPTYVAMRTLESDGAPRIITVVTDLSELKQVESKRDELAHIVDSAQVAVIGEDTAGTITSWNRAAEKIYGYAEAEMIGQSNSVITPPALRPVVAAMIGRIVRGETMPAYETVRTGKDGQRIDVLVALSPIRSDTGATIGISAIVSDISVRRRAEEKIWRLAHYDALTGLANRHAFVAALELAIGRARRGGHGFSVLYLDLDHFKDVNDTLGHPIGDRLLKAVAERLTATVRSTDTIARFGGDEFAIIENDIREPADSARLAVKILAALGEPFAIRGYDIRTGASIGIAVFGEDASDAEQLLSHADLALYQAKSQERMSFRFFTDTMDRDVRRRVVMEAELREAIGAEQLFLVYQPQVDAETGGIVGLEALVRWRHPDHGIVGPGDFIPVAERSGLIIALGRWVLRTACRQAKQWLDAGMAPRVTGVNLSALQFKRPLELENDVMAALAETGLPPERLELELTESVLMDVSQEHNDVLLRFREHGIRIGIDDFGTGYSSLEYLSRFSVDRIKIAQNFVLDLDRRPRYAAIVKTAIRLAQELEILVIVEGVETAAQLALIRSWGCREVQGYYFAKPLTVPEVTALLRAGKIVPATPERAA